eukprot:5562527-Prymnesium_polylepis.1
MRLKLLDTSPVSEALYLHVLTELDLPEREQAHARERRRVHHPTGCLTRARESCGRRPLCV